MIFEQSKVVQRHRSLQLSLEDGEGVNRVYNKIQLKLKRKGNRENYIKKILKSEEASET